jgi:hypothetical protein
MEARTLSVIAGILLISQPAFAALWQPLASYSTPAAVHQVKQPPRMLYNPTSTKRIIRYRIIPTSKARQLRSNCVT